MDYNELCSLYEYVCAHCMCSLYDLGNRNRRPRALRSGRLYIGSRGEINPVETSIRRLTYSGTHKESEKMKCFYLDHNSTTNSPID